MKLIIGLGNPGRVYNNTRHNTGAQILAQFAVSQGVELKPSAKFKANIAELAMGEQKVILATPTNFYNLAGESAQALCSYYKLDAPDVMVVHDELMLPLGTIRTRQGGSDAGNNGIKSITQHIGENTARLRIGIGNELRDQMDDADFVLSKFNASERAVLADLQHVAEACIEDFIYDTFAATTHQAA